VEIRKARRRGPVSLLLGLLCVPFAYSAAEAQTPQPAALSNFGPYNATFLAGGIGLNVALSADAPVLAAGAPWSVSGWLRSARASGASLTVVALGDPHSRDCRRLLLDQSRLQLQVGSDVVLHAPVPFEPGVWHAVAATYDGRQGHLYVDGKEVDSRTATTSVTAASLHIAPEDGADLTGEHHFGGDVADLRLHDRALDAQEVRALSSAKPNFNLIDFHQVGVGWPLQRTAWRGLQEPQPAWTLPHSRAPLPQASPPAASAPHANEPMLPVDDHSWLLRDWRLAAAPRVSATEETLSSSKYQERDWYPATVPGTVLTTLIADGVYPDPDYGLNNM
jgi:hypothetical protein